MVRIKEVVSMKILCCGDRNWTNYHVIKKYLSSFPKNTIIIEGEARGADIISKEIAESLGLMVIKFPADWDKYGKSAGPIRNRQMLDQNPDMVYAFHNDIKNSKGTKDCVTEAIFRNIPVKIITEKGDMDIKDHTIKIKNIKKETPTITI